jgi:hypothetical protein
MGDNMQDEMLVEPFAAVECFCDGFADFQLIDGVLRCVGYRLQPPSHLHGDPLKVIVMRLTVPIAGALSGSAKVRLIGGACHACCGERSDAPLLLS